MSGKRRNSRKRGRDLLRIADLLLCGEENAVTRKYLEQITGLNGREVQRAVQIARLHGIPILSSGSGFFLPATEDEKARFVRSMRHRAREISRAADAVEGAR